jgi:hydroxymethylpyrimidine pyrophosphatase-like HAD family hydrolase
MSTVFPVVVFTDLDDTLFSSVRKQPADADLQAQAYLQDGSPISYSSSRQRALQHWLRHSRCVVPVTARSLGAYRRVDLRFDSYAILSHGACVLLPDGTVDPHWTERMQGLLHSAAEPLRGALEALRHSRYNQTGQLQVRMIEEHGLALYALVKHAQGDAAAIRALADEVARPWLHDHPGFQLHLNDNNLAIIPPGIGKAAAVHYVSAQLHEELGEFMSVGMGDSLSDGHFMLDCDYALLPGRSQLGSALRAWLDR